MRHLILALLVLTVLLAACAQEQHTLALSACPAVVKITDPERQLTTFAPIITLLEGLGVPMPANGVPTPQGIKEMVATLTQTAGVDLNGDLWEVYPPVAHTGACLLLPLTDEAKFTAFVQAQPERKAMVLGKYALLAMEKGKELPQYTALKMDLTLASKRDIVISLQMAALAQMLQQDKAPKAEANAAGDEEEATAKETGLPDQFLTFLADMQTNVTRLEIAPATGGEDFSLETFHIPAPDSPLAKQLAGMTPWPGLQEYAGYLPEKLAYCAVGGPAFTGVPNLRMIFLRMVAQALAEGMLPEEEQQHFVAAVDRLITTCSLGRAIGVIAPPEETPERMSLVGIYRVHDAQQARAAVQGIFKAFADTGEIEDAGMPIEEKIGEAAVEVAVIPLQEMECRFAYVNDKLLVTLGEDSKKQMTALLERVQQQQAVYTAGARFKALQPTLPATACGFEAIYALDCARVVANFQDNEEQRAEQLKWLGILPAQKTPISTTQEITPQGLRTELRLPAEQMNFLYTLFKALNVQKKDAK